MAKLHGTYKDPGMVLKSGYPATIYRGGHDHDSHAAEEQVDSITYTHILFKGPVGGHET